jgi:hypothetical protein
MSFDLLLRTKMMSESGHLFRMFDRYDIFARITPGLLAPLIPGLCLTIAFPKIVTDNIYRTIGSGIIMLCLLYVFAGLARSRGRAEQQKLKVRWGAFPTEIVLRFRDNTIELPTKLAYHAALQGLAPDFQLPDAHAEERDPDGADGVYRAVVRRLIDLRRDPKYSLVHNDNIAYGFWRNLLGMRTLALVLAGFTLLGVLSAAATQMELPNTSFVAVMESMAANQMAAIVLLFLWIAFLLIIVRPFRVWDAGVTYAERLLSSLPPPTARKPRGRVPNPEKKGAQG